MFTQRDSKLWKAYCHKLLELGITIEGPRTELLPKTFNVSDYTYDGKYGEVEVLVEYTPWKRMSPGWASVCMITEHSARLMFKLSTQPRGGKEGRAWRDNGEIRVECFLLR